MVSIGYTPAVGCIIMSTFMAKKTVIGLVFLNRSVRWISDPVKTRRFPALMHSSSGNTAPAANTTLTSPAGSVDTSAAGGEGVVTPLIRYNTAEENDLIMAALMRQMGLEDIPTSTPVPVVAAHQSRQMVVAPHQPQLAPAEEHHLINPLGGRMRRTVTDKVTTATIVGPTTIRKRTETRSSEDTLIGPNDPEYAEIRAALEQDPNAMTSGKRTVNQQHNDGPAIKSTTEVSGTTLGKVAKILGWGWGFAKTVIRNVTGTNTPASDPDPVPVPVPATKASVSDPVPATKASVSDPVPATKASVSDPVPSWADDEDDEDDVVPAVTPKPSVATLTPSGRGGKSRGGRGGKSNGRGGRGNIKCKFGDNCTNHSCTYRHENGHPMHRTHQMRGPPMGGGKWGAGDWPSFHTHALLPVPGWNVRIQRIIGDVLKGPNAGSLGLGAEQLKRLVSILFQGVSVEEFEMSCLRQVGPKAKAALLPHLVHMFGTAADLMKCGSIQQLVHNNPVNLQSVTPLVIVGRQGPVKYDLKECGATTGLSGNMCFYLAAYGREDADKAKSQLNAMLHPTLRSDMGAHHMQRPGVMGDAGPLATVVAIEQHRPVIVVDMTDPAGMFGYEVTPHRLLNGGGQPLVIVRRGFHFVRGVPNGVPRGAQQFAREARAARSPTDEEFARDMEIFMADQDEFTADQVEFMADQDEFTADQVEFMADQDEFETDPWYPPSAPQTTRDARFGVFNI